MNNNDTPLETLIAQTRAAKSGGSAPRNTPNERNSMPIRAAGEPARRTGAPQSDQSTVCRGTASRPEQAGTARTSGQAAGVRRTAAGAAKSRTAKAGTKTKESAVKPVARYYDEGDSVRARPAKKRHILRTVIIVLLVLLLAGLGLYAYLIKSYIGEMNIVETGPRADLSGVALTSDEDVRNILVIGSDTRYADKNGRSDSMILVSLDTKNNRVTLSSFMRDMYVEIPGHGWDKMNASLAKGGAELVMDTLAYNFGIQVDEYLYVDFYSFVDIVDAVGGVEIKLSDAEAAGMKKPMSEQNRILGKAKGSDYLNAGGTYLLNGNQALGYARLRYVGNADFERTDRQRTVIKKIMEKAKTLSVPELNAFAKTSFGSLTTNIDEDALFKLLFKAPVYTGYAVQELRIPADDTWSYGTAGTQSILTVDFDANKDLLKSTIYGK
ncbi:MAG: LCP family protein [Oscillospiraceae bacterium]